MSGRQVKAMRRLYGSSKAARRSDARRLVLAIVGLTIIAALLAQVALGVLT